MCLKFRSNLGNIFTFYKQILCLFKVKEDTTAKEKIEKIDTSPTTDILNTLVKSDKLENTEKPDNKKADNMGKIQGMEKQDFKPEKNGKLEKVSDVEETKKEVKEEKKNGSEKVNKTVKNEKNVKAAKETSKPTAANGTKDLISSDKVKVCLEEEGHKPTYMSLRGCVQMFDGMQIFLFMTHYPVKRVFHTKISFFYSLCLHMDVI